MMGLSDQFLRECNEQGILVAPSEDETSFLSRCPISLLLAYEDSLEVKDEMARRSKVQEGPSDRIENPLEEIQGGEEAKDERLTPFLLRVYKVYGRLPQALHMIFSTKGLLPWEGGATWVGDKQKGAVIHLRPFKGLHKLFWSTLLGYTMEELGAHEAVHGMRVGFEEPKYEEYLAYQSSSSASRRFFGPLFRSSYELYPLVLAMACPLIAFSLLDAPIWRGLAFFPLGCVLGGLLLRLIHLHRHARGGLQGIRVVFQEGVNPLHVALLLTDEEISLFSREDSSVITTYIEEERSLRWQQILACYPIRS